MMQRAHMYYGYLQIVCMCVYVRIKVGLHVGVTIIAHRHTACALCCRRQHKYDAGTKMHLNV